MMKIVVLDGYAENPGDLSWAGFEALGDLTVYERTPPDLTMERLSGAQAALTNKTVISAAILDRCPELKYIGVLATGYNVVDTEAARARDVVVSNVPSYGTAAVSQFAVALLLEICHHVGRHDQAVKAGRWESCPDYSFWEYPLIELAGRTMGLIGFGRIGLATGRIARALGMEVLAYSPHAGQVGRPIARCVDLDQLLTESDVVSLHCPLTPETRGLINRASLARMKSSAILINTARGDLVVEEDLAEALNHDRLYAAAVDVVSVEPIRGDNPLLKAKNCLITPHIAWAALASRRRLMATAVENFQAFLSGQPRNQV